MDILRYMGKINGYFDKKYQYTKINQNFKK